VALLAEDPKKALGKIRQQQVYDYGPDIKLIPTYHPSYLLRGGGVKHRSYSAVVDDFLAAKQISS
jgi:uracil-DNA glycosylase